MLHDMYKRWKNGQNETEDACAAKKGVCLFMPSKKEKKPFDVEHMTPEEQLKFEIAEELGLKDRVLSGGWRSLTSRESGRIGGLMTKRRREMRENKSE